ncbi:hypothetical protein J5N97_022417 [Dioscorea zingiberensis]|uniref:Alpha/beta hydrolase fold-3 domain-containing protein n=1 Tax=Dioscorea zingiberensis TaxID=325984 RepID=A0A9D5HAV3_9LILI|nr:hypothetical protein J5N97_022417 [Dioscorea zingiberensis]
MESLSHGVLIIGWPLGGDQMFTCKFLEEEVGVCVELARGNMEDMMSAKVEREGVKKMVEMVMGGTEKGLEMKKKATEISEMIRASMERSPNPSFTTPVDDDGFIEWKDLHFGSQDLDLPLRLYRPSNPSSPSPLPIFFYFHDGNFLIGSCIWPNCHCFRLACDLSPIIVAPNYSLSAKHLLPAALD